MGVFSDIGSCISSGEYSEVDTPHARLSRPRCGRPEVSRQFVLAACGGKHQRRNLQLTKAADFMAGLVNTSALPDLCLGRHIHTIRLAKGLSVKSLSELAGVTAGFISQVEHGYVAPSIDTLRRIARALDIPVFHLLLGDELPNELVRAHERRHVTIPGRSLVYEIVTSQRNSKFGIMIGTLGANEATSDDLNSHEGEECIIIKRGGISIEMPHIIHELNANDSLYFNSMVPHRFLNPTNEPSVFMLVLSPPRF